MDWPKKKINESRKKRHITLIAGADPGFDKGGAPDRGRPKLPTVHSSIV